MSLFSFFKKQPQRALGIEITDRSIRWSEVAVGDTAFEIETHGLVNVAYQPWAQQADAHDMLVKDLAPLSVYKKMPIVCVLPESLTHTTYITLGIDNESPADAIERAVESYIADHPIFVTSDTVCLYDIIKQEASQITIVITLYQSSKTKVLKDVFAALGFADISFTPLHDALYALHMDENPALMLSVGAGHTSIVQMADGHLQGYAQIPFGAKNVLNHIRDVVGHDRALKVYARYGMKSSHRDPVLYARIVQEAMPVIERAQRMMIDTGKDHSIILVGEYADIPGLDTFIAQQLRRAPAILDMERRFVSPDIRLPVIDAHDMLRFAPALGAAIDYLESR